MKKRVLNVLSILAVFGLASCNKIETTASTDPIKSQSEVEHSSGEEISSVESLSQKSNESSKEQSSTEEIASSEQTSLESASTDSYDFSQDKSHDRLPSTEGSYYANVNLTLKDAEFRKNLSKVINNGFRHRSYDEAYTIIADTDEDPNNKANCICLYTGRSMSKKDHSNTTGFNREHVWAKSHGFPSSGNPYSDVHHLRVTGMQINSTRGNSDFYEFGPKEEYKNSGLNKYTSNHFEPRDEVKGDVARMMFYMATMYGFDGQYNLTLTTDKTTSGSKGNGRFGNLETLVKWSLQDPVSEAERFRNEIVYKEQNNRNPYIDHPEYVLNAYPEFAQKCAGSSTIDITSTTDLTETSTNVEVESESSSESTSSSQVATGNVKLDISDTGLGNGFIANATCTASGYKVVASYGAGATKGEPVGLKVGANPKARTNANAEINGEKFVATLSIKDTIFKNVESVEYVTTCAWDDINWKIFFFDGTTYQEISSGSLVGTGKKGATEVVLSAKLDAPKDGTFVLAITNTSTTKGCRLNVKEIAISAKE